MGRAGTGCTRAVVSWAFSLCCAMRNEQMCGCLSSHEQQPSMMEATQGSLVTLGSTSTYCDVYYGACAQVCGKTTVVSKRNQHPRFLCFYRQRNESGTCANHYSVRSLTPSYWSIVPPIIATFSCAAFTVETTCALQAVVCRSSAEAAALLHPQRWRLRCCAHIGGLLLLLPLFCGTVCWSLSRSPH